LAKPPFFVGETPVFLGETPSPTTSSQARPLAATRAPGTSSRHGLQRCRRKGGTMGGLKPWENGGLMGFNGI